MTVEDFIRYESESAMLDFKREQYNLGNDAIKHELLKDLSAFANHPSEDDKYIIVGVTELNGVASQFHDIPVLIDESKYQQYVHSNIEPPINFEYKRLIYQNKELAYFRIFNNFERPYLFKKEISSAGKVEFRTGDGYIRHGTSTRKLNREDLERIYQKRHQIRDRKEDIVATVSVVPCDDHALASYQLKCLEVSIENKSLRSIALDIDLTVLDGDDFKLITVHEFKRILNDEATKRRRRDQANSILNYQRISGFDLSDVGERNPFPVNMPSLTIAVSEQNGHIIATRNRLRGDAAGLSIPQMGKWHCVFERTLILYSEKPVNVAGEITIRSDDFSGGAMVVPFSLHYDR